MTERMTHGVQRLKTLILNCLRPFFPQAKRSLLLHATLSPHCSVLIFAQFFEQLLPHLPDIAGSQRQQNIA